MIAEVVKAQDAPNGKQAEIRPITVYKGQPSSIVLMSLPPSEFITEFYAGFEYKNGDRPFFLVLYANPSGLGDILHRGIDGFGEIVRLGQLKQAGEAGVSGQVDGALGLTVGGLWLQPSGVEKREFGVHLVELRLHLSQGDKREDGLGVLVGAQGAVGPELVGGREQTPR